MFDHIVLVIIFLNCITIAMERPKIEPHSAVSFRGYRFPVLRMEPTPVAGTPLLCTRSHFLSLF